MYTLLDKFDIDICHPLNRNLLPMKLVDDEFRRYFLENDNNLLLSSIINVKNFMWRTETVRTTALCT